MGGIGLLWVDSWWANEENSAPRSPELSALSFRLSRVSFLSHFARVYYCPQTPIPSLTLNWGQVGYFLEVIVVITSLLLLICILSFGASPVPESVETPSCHASFADRSACALIWLLPVSGSTFHQNHPLSCGQPLTLLWCYSFTFLCGCCTAAVPASVESTAIYSLAWATFLDFLITALLSLRPTCTRDPSWWLSELSARLLFPILRTPAQSHQHFSHDSCRLLSTLSGCAPFQSIPRYLRWSCKYAGLIMASY